MRVKIISIATLMLLILSTSYSLVNAEKNIIDTEPKLDVNSYETDFDTKYIRIAMLGSMPGNILGSYKIVFPWIFDDYEWVVGNRSYKFILTEIFDKDILDGKLTVDNYDVLLLPGGGVGDGESMLRGFFRMPETIKWKKKIMDFIEDGGGYFSVCGGTALATELAKTPTTFSERQYDKSAIGFTCVKSYYKDVCSPVGYPLQKLFPEKLGAGYYCCAMDYGASKNQEVYGIVNGVPVDTVINTSHPIFKGYSKETERIRWVGGPALVVPKNLDRNVSVLAWYPEDGISNNKSTQINAWRYTGGILGLIKSFMKEFKTLTENRELLEYGKYLPLITYNLATDWEKTDKIIDLDFSNKPCMTAEIYPNENRSRIVMTTMHPEAHVWWGGHIEAADDTDYNCLNDGLHKWVNITPIQDTIEDEHTHTWWLVRRSVAWAAKIPDSDLPPVHGPSQVCEIKPEEQPCNFTIYGNAQVSGSYGFFDYDINPATVGNISLDLYYRHSDDNVNWSESIYYSTDPSGKDGWSWEFNASIANESGYYQFYSIRKVDYESYTEIERTNNLADTKARIVY